MSKTLTAVFGVAEATERPGATGFVLRCHGAFDNQKPDHAADESDALDREFFPAETIAGVLTLDWSRFAGNKPLSAYHGAQIKVTLEAVSFPVAGDERGKAILDATDRVQPAPAVHGNPVVMVKL